MEPLQPQEESPFIGQLEPGKHQLAIETNMFRAPGFAYTTPPTDFLLIRSATGAISLRELTGCIAVGQEVPAMRAPVPHSREVRQAHTLHGCISMCSDTQHLYVEISCSCLLRARQEQTYAISTGKHSLGA